MMINIGWVWVALSAIFLIATLLTHDLDNFIFAVFFGLIGFLEVRYE